MEVRGGLSLFAVTNPPVKGAFLVDGFSLTLAPAPTGKEADVVDQRELPCVYSRPFLPAPSTPGQT